MQHYQGFAAWCQVTAIQKLGLGIQGSRIPDKTQTSKTSNEPTFWLMIGMCRPIFLIGWSVVAEMIHGSERERTLQGKQQEITMSLVRLLGFTTLSCGCVVGRYRELSTNREVAYVEEKGHTCDAHGHRRNHTIQSARVASYAPQMAAKAS